jgi:hypothetical protein
MGFTYRYSCFAEAASSEVYPVSTKVYFDQLLPTRDGDYHIFENIGLLICI